MYVQPAARHVTTVCAVPNLELNFSGGVCVSVFLPSPVELIAVPQPPFTVFHTPQQDLCAGWCFCVALVSLSLACLPCSCWCFLSCVGMILVTLSSCFRPVFLLSVVLFLPSFLPSALLYVVAIGVSFGGILYEKNGRRFLATTQVRSKGRGEERRGGEKRGEKTPQIFRTAVVWGGEGV